MGVENLKKWTDIPKKDVDSKKVRLDNALAILEGKVAKVEEKVDKEKSVKNKETVFSHPCSINWNDGMYAWELKNGKPDGYWAFTTKKNGFHLEWKFENGSFCGGSGMNWWMTNLKTGEEIMGVTYKDGEYTGTIKGDLVDYKGKWDKNLNLKECDYEGVKVRLHTVGSKHYLESSNGDTLQIKDGFEPTLTAVRIAKMISIVKKRKKDHNVWLDYFETDDGIKLQADYKGKFWDTDLLSDCSKLVWINASDLSKRLNKSRKDFGI